MLRPLEVKTFERLNQHVGVSEEFIALDPVWMSKIDFLLYRPVHLLLEKPGTDRVNVDPMWLEVMQLLNEDLHQLLQMDHHKFWCQAVNDKSLNKTLDSYLHHAPRPHDELIEFLSQDTQELMRSIHRRVFMVLLRLSVHKESSDDFISPEAYSNIIYEHRIFDIPKLLDLCVLYGDSNRALVTKMVTNVFKRQPKYEEDWRQVVSEVLCTLSTMSDKLMGEEGGAVRLDGHSRMSPSVFADVVLHLADFVATLHSFLSIYPRAACSLMVAGFMERVIKFYEATIPRLQENWHRLKAQLLNQKHIKDCFRCLKSDLVWLVHEVLAVCFLSPQPPDSSGVRSKVSIDDFVFIMAEMANERSFLREYKKQFDLVGDVQSVRSAHPEIPEVHFDYVLIALEDTSTAKEVVDKKSGGQALPSSTKDDDIAAAGIVMESLVSKVKDLLPHLGEGFIETCLREFGNNPAMVIDKVLEDSLPPHLNNLDFTLPAGKLTACCPDSKISAELSHGDSLIDQRKNVFDNDEFDVFRNLEKTDMSRVHIGKKFDSISTGSVLNDKTHLEGTRERYDAYKIETEGDYISEEQASKMSEDGFASRVVEYGYDLMYEDEYDDTYDSQNVGAADDATDEQFIVKRLNKKGLVGRKLHEASDDDDEDLMRYPNMSKKLADGRSREQLIAIKSAKDLISSLSGLSGGGRQTKGDRPPSKGKFGKHGHEVHAWRSGPRDQEDWKSECKEGLQRDDEDYRRGGDRDNWRSGDRDGWRSGDRDGWRSGDRDGWRSGDRDGWRSGDRDGWRSGEQNHDGHAKGTKKEVKKYEETGNVVLSREVIESERTPQGRGKRTTHSASAQGHGKRDPQSASAQWRSESTPQSASAQGRGARAPQSASAQGRGERAPQCASSQRHGGRAPQSASAQWHGERTPQSAQGCGERAPQSASAQRHGERAPQSASAQGCGERSSQPDSARQSESRARQTKDRNKGSRANHNRRDLADKKRRGGML